MNEFFFVYHIQQHFVLIASCFERKSCATGTAIHFNLMDS